MKKIICNLLCYCFCLFAYAQSAKPEFTLPLYFEDAKGNKDTIYTGYDPLAKESIWNEFEEKDIKLESMKEQLDVRLTPWLSPIKSKAYYTTGSCTPTLPISDQNGFRSWILVRLLAKNPPITVKWDSTLINDCTKNSFFHRSRGVMQGFFKEENRYLKGKNGKLVYTTKDLSGYKNAGKMDYVTPSGDTIYYLFFYLLDKNSSAQVTSNEDINTENEITIFPNPANNLITIKTTENLSVSRFTIYNTNGQVLTEKILDTPISEQSEIDISGLAQGIYYLKTATIEGQTIMKKFIKLE